MAEQPHVFFSYAHEDREAGETVYAAIAERQPNLWMKFEIAGGQSLIEKISGGMDRADRFLVFLSRSSIDEPWVQLNSDARSPSRSAGGRSSAWSLHTATPSSPTATPDECNRHERREEHAPDQLNSLSAALEN